MSARGTKVGIMPAAAAFQAWFGLAPVEADVLSALFDAPPQGMSVQELAVAVACAPNAISVHMVQIRRAMETASIVTVDRLYRLSDVGAEDCREALTQTIASLVLLLEERDAA